MRAVRIEAVPTDRPPGKTSSVESFVANWLSGWIMLTDLATAAVDLVAEIKIEEPDGRP
jgi:hypothetical protein